MKEIVHHKFSLFLLEQYYGGWGSELVESCFKYVETFNSLEEAQDAQKDYKRKSIILPSY